MALLSVFTSHVIKAKNRKHLTNKVKNLEYDRWLPYKQPREDSRVSPKVIEHCMETPKHDDRKVTENLPLSFAIETKSYSYRAPAH